MVYSLQLRKLGLATFRGWEVATFAGRSLLSGFTTFGIYLRPQKNDVNFGGSLLSEIDGITVCSS